MTCKCQRLFHLVELTQTIIYMFPGISLFLISPVFQLIFFLSFICLKSTLVKCIFFLPLCLHYFFFFFFNGSIFFSKTYNCLIFIECLLKVLLKYFSWEWFSFHISFCINFIINTTSIKFLILYFFLIKLTIFLSLLIHSEFCILA